MSNSLKTSERTAPCHTTAAELPAGSVKAQLASAMDALLPDLVRLSEWLHDHPETAWNEHKAVHKIVETLRSQNFDVVTPYLGFPTAFHATAPNSETAKGASFRVGFLAEYDPLPGLGHACGHNLIAAISVGAAIALSTVRETTAQDELTGLHVEVIGTPAEEGGGGKIELLDQGAFHGLHLALMAHPAPVDVAEAKPFAVAHWLVEYRGRSAHAGAYPERGINANDAFVVAQVALGLLRQQLPSDVRVHGIVTSAGAAPNAIPDYTSGRWYIRAQNLDELEDLERRVQRCFEAGAHASGATLTITPESKPYASMRNDEPALEAYRENALLLGREFCTDPHAGAMNRASTDMGNVSQVVRAIHPYIGVGGLASNHQAEFAQSCIGPEAQKALRDAAIALAWTAVDIYEADHGNV